MESRRHSSRSSSSVSITVSLSSVSGALRSIECTNVLTIGQYSCVAYVTHRRSMSSIGMRASSSLRSKFVRPNSICSSSSKPSDVPRFFFSGSGNPSC